MAFLISGSADVCPATKTRPGTFTAGPAKISRGLSAVKSTCSYVAWEETQQKK